MTGDFERLSFNTIVAALMELTNTLVRARRAPVYGTPEWDEALDIFNRMLAPVVPHIAEEIWHERGMDGSVHVQPWPATDEAAAVRDTVTIGVQVGGKVRGQVSISKTATQEEALAAARAQPDVARFLRARRWSRRSTCRGGSSTSSSARGAVSAPVDLIPSPPVPAIRDPDAWFDRGCIPE